MSRELEKWLESRDPFDPLPPNLSRHYQHWAQRYPHWWDTLFHHAPARRQLRDKLRQVKKGEIEDDGNWPNHKKPHKYYW
jgi:hypothetical protein